MSCVYPIDAWRSAKRSESGKHGITFKIKDANIDQSLQIPCGKCIGCAKNKAREWGIRIAHEASLHEQNSFLTLTYKDNPGAINKRDLQLFFKRLRKRGPLRYFACGEYGERTHRPHYHAIIFGQDFRDGSYQLNGNNYSHAIVEIDWGYGFVSIGEVSQASIMYVAGYTNKKILDPDTFNMMSTRPGIGKQWLEKYRDDLISGQVIIQGQKYPVPKRYISWNEDFFAELKAERAAHFEAMTPEEKWKKRVGIRGREINMKAEKTLRERSVL